MESFHIYGEGEGLPMYRDSPHIKPNRLTGLLISIPWPPKWGHIKEFPSKWRIS
jgi:hypothetical protein